MLPTMRFIVKYTKPNQVEGARLFDVIGIEDVSADEVQKAARLTAGATPRWWRS